MKPTLTVIDANTQLIREATEAYDRHQLKRIQADLETLMLRHGRGKIIGICVEAIKSAEQRGAKW